MFSLPWHYNHSGLCSVLVLLYLLRWLGLLSTNYLADILIHCVLYLTQPEEYEKLGSYALIGLPTELYEKRWVWQSQSRPLRHLDGHMRAFSHSTGQKIGHISPVLDASRDLHLPVDWQLH